MKNNVINLFDRVMEEMNDRPVKFKRPAPSFPEAYIRLARRKDRLKRLLELKAPHILVRTSINLVRKSIKDLGKATYKMLEEDHIVRVFLIGNDEKNKYPQV